MAHPQEHASRRLLASFEESAKLMWSAYEFHMQESVRDSAWQEKKSKLFAACDAADRRVWQLRELIAKESGVWVNPGYSDPD
jgi:hypothetical protein